MLKYQVMYKKSCVSCNKPVISMYKKISIILRTVTYNIDIKLEFNRMHQLDTILIIF